jgi:hypothetical protein
MLPSGVPQLGVPTTPNLPFHLDTRPLPSGYTVSQDAQRGTNKRCKDQPDCHLKPHRPTHDTHGRGLGYEWDQRCRSELRNSEHRLDHLLLNLCSAFLS